MTRKSTDFGIQFHRLNSQKTFWYGKKNTIVHYKWQHELCSTVMFYCDTPIQKGTVDVSSNICATMIMCELLVFVCCLFSLLIRLWNHFQGLSSFLNSESQGWDSWTGALRCSSVFVAGASKMAPMSSLRNISFNGVFEFHPWVLANL